MIIHDVTVATNILWFRLQLHLEVRLFLKPRFQNEILVLALHVTTHLKDAHILTSASQEQLSLSVCIKHLSIKAKSYVTVDESYLTGRLVDDGSDKRRRS